MNTTDPSLPARRLSVAPMLDWTDRHYRFLARQISRHAWLYTEMIHAGAIIHGDAERFLGKDEGENPVALQLGGSHPADLARAAKKAAQYGYDEINLNCGCPSPRVQKGSFGACLMNEVGLVADCLNAMQEAAPDCAVTIKHRIGIDRQTDYQTVCDFVGTLAGQTACRTYIVHARNAWLEGLSPKENRDVPPLKYDYVYRLKQDFPELEIIINGGIKTNAEIAEHLRHVDGVMIGREAYHNPMLMQPWDRLFYDESLPETDFDRLIPALYRYMQRMLAADPGLSIRHMLRHYLGLLHGRPNARLWRQMLSDAKLLQSNRPELILETWAKVSASQEA
ncbi:tRNA dihydrouridine(20/20a) synthase DusA [Eikenella glucosivorans]|uniref:tRNA dihydrouridine(20/20a) synthase DusA n=1 Tax=Eikenella glucosivorans TaxID=2766967 RepID=UPI00236766A4|nr:tRNA dihydrouridine(20/20a) synthase DusA [Eikenella glucosivorans]